MPTSTFYRLPRQKREALDRAIISEFSQSVFENVTVARIIQNAGIPRGSYYQYFTSKEDLISYVIQGCRAQFERIAIQCARAANGNLFFTVRLLVHRFREEIVSEESAGLARNLFAYLSGRACLLSVRSDADLRSVLQWIDRSLLRRMSDEEFSCLIALVKQLVYQTLSAILSNPAQAEKSEREFNTTLHILMVGAAKPSEPTKKELSHAD